MLFVCRDMAEVYQGVRNADAPRAVAAVPDIVITMMPSGKFLREVALDDSGLIDGFKSGAMDRAYDRNRDYAWLHPLSLRLEGSWHDGLQNPLMSNMNIL